MSLLLLFGGKTIHALTGVAVGQGVGAARLAVLRRMAAYLEAGEQSQTKGCF